MDLPKIVQTVSFYFIVAKENRNVKLNFQTFRETDCKTRDFYNRNKSILSEICQKQRMIHS